MSTSSFLKKLKNRQSFNENSLKKRKLISKLDNDDQDQLVINRILKDFRQRNEPTPESMTGLIEIPSSDEEDKEIFDEKSVSKEGEYTGTVIIDDDDENGSISDGGVDLVFDETGASPIQDSETKHLNNGLITDSLQKDLLKIEFIKDRLMEEDRTEGDIKTMNYSHENKKILKEDAINIQSITDNVQDSKVNICLLKDESFTECSDKERVRYFLRQMQEYDHPKVVIFY